MSRKRSGAEGAAPTQACVPPEHRSGTVTGPVVCILARPLLAVTRSWAKCREKGVELDGFSQNSRSRTVGHLQQVSDLPLLSRPEGRASGCQVVALGGHGLR